jgi:hypothetical protein
MLSGWRRSEQIPLLHIYINHPNTPFGCKVLRKLALGLARTVVVVYHLALSNYSRQVLMSDNPMCLVGQGRVQKGFLRATATFLPSP